MLQIFFCYYLFFSGFQKSMFPFPSFCPNLLCVALPNWKLFKRFVSLTHDSLKRSIPPPAIPVLIKWCSRALTGILFQNERTRSGPGHKGITFPIGRLYMYTHTYTYATYIKTAVKKASWINLESVSFSNGVKEILKRQNTSRQVHKYWKSPDLLVLSHSI